MRRRPQLAAYMAALAAAAVACTNAPTATPPPGTSAPLIPPSATSPGASPSAASTVEPSHTPTGRGGPRPTSPTPPWEQPLGSPASGHVQPGSNPNVLPGDVLIADKLNNRLIILDPQGRIRWQFPRPGDLARGQTFLVPDDAFFAPNGRDIIATEEDNFVIRVIDVATHRVVYQYGKPGVAGSGPNRLWNPDDAMMLPGGDILTADIKNQRILLIGAGKHTILRQWGVPGGGYHQPPTRYGAPNGVFPAGGGRYLVTEIRGDWVDAIDLHGHVYWTAHPPGIAYPSDTNRIGVDRYITVDYSAAGQILIFNSAGHPIWRYHPPASAALDHPSLALPLPNGDIVCNDDMNHRVIVVDPHTDRVVWQYGHTGVPGRAPGYLNNPDGIDLVPPHTLADNTTGTAGRTSGPGH